MNPAQSPPQPVAWSGTIRRVLFDKQPPPTVRKSNFFSFTIQLQDGGGQRLRVRNARFIDFLMVDWPTPAMPEGLEPQPTSRSRSQSSSRSRSKVKQERAQVPTSLFSPVGTNPAATPGSDAGTPLGLFSPGRFPEASPASRQADNESPGKVAATPQSTFLPAKSNGIEYEVELEHPHGRIVRERLYLCLVDNRNCEVVHYEGQDRNPEMRRVLLTHEVTCSRCSNSATGCGNKTAAPSDPTIQKENGECSLIFYVKCNQNCLRTPGSPKQGRRFKVMLSTGQTPSDGHNHKLGISEEIFVHNNSKHGRQVISKATSATDVMADSTCGASQAGAATTPGEHSPDSNVPSISLIWPKHGWTTGGQKVAIIGENFSKTMQVVFGHNHVEAEMYNSRILLVTTPAVHQECKVEITLMQRQGNKMKQSCTTQPGHFEYIEPIQTVECVTERLQAVLSLPIPTVVSVEDIFQLLNERLSSAVCQQCQGPTNLPPQPTWPTRRPEKRPYHLTMGRHPVSDSTSPAKIRPAPLVIPESDNNHLTPGEVHNYQPMMPSSSSHPMPSSHSWPHHSGYQSGEQMQPGQQAMSGHSGQAMFFSHDQGYGDQGGGSGGGGGGGGAMGMQPRILAGAGSSIHSSHASSPSPECMDRNQASGGMHDDPNSLPSKPDSDQQGSRALYTDSHRLTSSSQHMILERPPSGPMHAPTASMHPSPYQQMPPQSSEDHYGGGQMLYGGSGGSSHKGQVDRKPVIDPCGQAHVPSSAAGYHQGPPPITPGMAVYFQSGASTGGQNAPGPAYLYPGNIYSPSLALASPAQFPQAHESGSIFTFPSSGDAPPAPSGFSLTNGQPLTPILLMNAPSGAFSNPAAAAAASQQDTYQHQQGYGGHMPPGRKAMGMPPSRPPPIAGQHGPW